MSEVGDAWQEIVLPEEYPRLIYLFVKSVVLDFLSPRFFTLAITWRDPSWQKDEPTCYKYGNPSVTWTEKEEDALAILYPVATRFDLLKTLPRRTYLAICEHAKTRGIRRTYHAEEIGVPYLTCWHDWQLMQEYGLVEEQLRKEKGNVSFGVVEVCMLIYLPLLTRRLSEGSRWRGFDGMDWRLDWRRIPRQAVLLLPGPLL